MEKEKESETKLILIKDLQKEENKALIIKVRTKRKIAINNFLFVRTEISC